MIDISKGRYWGKPWSLVDGCTSCSPGCDHCWSEAMTHRMGAKVTRRDRFPSPLSIPLKRRKPTVYAIWNDLFHEAMPDQFVYEATRVMRHSFASQHIFLVLTKRPQKMLRLSNLYDELPNVWSGLTVCNQQEADEKIPIFLQVPGKKFLSIEPMLGEIDLRGISGPGKWRLDALECPPGVKGSAINAVILGGETGPGARPMHPYWVRSVRDQCAVADVPFFFKSWGAWKPCVDDHVECEGNKSTAMRLSGEILTDENPYWKDKAFGGSDQGFWKAGSKAGRLLDGRTHDDLPWR